MHGELTMPISRGQKSTLSVISRTWWRLQQPATSANLLFIDCYLCKSPFVRSCRAFMTTTFSYVDNIRSIYVNERRCGDRVQRKRWSVAILTRVDSSWPPEGWWSTRIRKKKTSSRFWKALSFLSSESYLMPRADWYRDIALERVVRVSSTINHPHRQLYELAARAGTGGEHLVPSR